MPLDSAQERPAGLLTLDVACHLYGIPRPLFDEHTARGDRPRVAGDRRGSRGQRPPLCRLGGADKGRSGRGCSWCD